jgi:hypothetical protein
MSRGRKFGGCLLQTLPSPMVWYVCVGFDSPWQRSFGSEVMQKSIFLFTLLLAQPVCFA